MILVHLDITPTCTNISYMRRSRKKEISSEHRLLLYTYLLSLIIF